MTAISRFLAYTRRHGWRETLLRCQHSVWRALHFGRMVLFSCKLPIDESSRFDGLLVQRKSRSTISSAELEKLLSARNHDVAGDDVKVRFDAGAELWIAMVDGTFAGFGWTIKGRTIEPHFFALQPDEVHLFDFLVFPEYRGRNVNGRLVTGILQRLGGEQVRRAHIECAAWNDAQLVSLRKTAFNRHAVASRHHILGIRWVSLRRDLSSGEFC